MTKKRLEGLLTAVINTGVLSLIFMLIGNNWEFELAPWLKSWGIACVVILILGQVVPQLIKGIVDQIIKDH